MEICKIHQTIEVSVLFLIKASKYLHEIVNFMLVNTYIPGGTAQ